MKINIINNNEICINYFITDTSYEFNIPYIDENHELLFGTNNNLKCLTIDNTFYRDEPFDEIRLSLKFKNNKIIKECNSVLGITS